VRLETAETLNATQIIVEAPRTELATRFGLVAEVAGPVAVATVAETTKTPETEFDTKLADFLRPNINMSFADQLWVQREFWGALGHELPSLSEEQQAKLQTKLEAHPTHRIMPAPLLDLDGRESIAEIAKEAFLKNSLSKRTSGLWTPYSSRRYGTLLVDPEATVHYDGTNYAMRYKTPSGITVMGRADYKNELEVAGQTVKGERNTPWTWSVMNVAVHSSRTNTTARALYGKVDPTATPEAHIGMQLLHQANGTPNTAWGSDLVNEAVFELDKQGNTKTLAYVACVSFSLNVRQVIFNLSNADYQHDDFGVRTEESGL
jgi:hypothetical protein